MTVFYDYIDEVTVHGVSYYSFSDENERVRFAEYQKTGEYSGEFPTAQKMYLHRCEGFSDTILKNHLTDNKNDRTPEATADMIWGSPGDADLPQVLDVMQKIGKTAFNATLPGQ